MTAIRFIRSAASAAGLAVCVQGASAQFDLNKLLNGRLPTHPREIQRAAQTFQAQGQCQKLKEWVASVPSAAGARRAEEALPLVDDALFAGHFGKTYDQLTIDDFRQTQAAQRECQRLGNMTPGEAQTVHLVWNERTHMHLSRVLAANRAQRSEFAALLQELDGLQPNEADWRRIDAIQSRGGAIRSASAEERKALQAKVDAARERIGVPLYRAKVGEAVQGPAGAPGIAALARLQDEVAKARLPAPAHDALRGPLAERIAQWAPAVVQEERSRAPLPVAGAEGLGKSMAWTEDFDRRLQSVMTFVPGLGELRREVLAARATALQSMQPALLAEVRAARAESDLSALLRRTLLAEEQASGPGRIVRDAASERSALLNKAAKDQAMFGAQHDRPVAVAEGVPSRAAATLPDTPVAGAVPVPAVVARCDALAAHPDDPQRAATGVADEQMSAKAALAACADAVKASPKLARLHFQHGRALLEVQRINEAVAAFERAAALNHGGAFIYLANAYEVGGGGLPKSAAKSADYHQRGLQLGFGSAPKVSAAAGGKVLDDPADLNRRYEEGKLMRAVYYGDSSAVAADSVFVKAYLLAQVDALVQMCRSFTISEYRQYQAAATRSVMPNNEREMMQAGFNNLAAMAKLLVDARTNPQSMVDAGMRQQRMEDAPTFGQKDMVVFTETYGGCNAPPVERYARNLRAFFSGPAASAR